ncbi:MAG: hypothetical protein SPI01_07090 [Succiniclasticum sp.]|nr:hypothetical protein [Succiniclasticum sp.]
MGNFVLKVLGVSKERIMFSGGENTVYSLIFIWFFVLLCSIRGCYRNFKTGEVAWGVAFGVMIPASLYFLADLLGILPAGAPHVYM